MAAGSTSLAAWCARNNSWITRLLARLCRQTVPSEDGPLHPTLIDVDEFFRQAEYLPLMPEIADKNGTLRVEVDPKYLPRPRAPQAPVLPQPQPQAYVPSKLDELYAPHFQRLEQDLKARSAHLPASVTEGKVATLDLVGVSVEGDAVFEPTLEDHEAAPAK